jgi:hypothetical protein
MRKIKLKGSQRRMITGNGITFEKEAPQEVTTTSTTELSKVSTSAQPIGLGKPSLGQFAPKSQMATAPNDTAVTVSSGLQPNVNLTKPKFKKQLEPKPKKVRIKMV